MTTPDIQQAKEWAKESVYFDDSSGFASAVRVIQSLPDQWVDAEKVREVYDRYRASEITLHEAFHATVELATLPLPTFEDMTAEEREACQWMQAQIFTTFSTPGIITNIDEYARSAIILFTDGMAKNVPWKGIAPRPGLPKLEWPGGGVEDAPVTDGEPTPPRPEDVPVGEAWLAKCAGFEGEWIGTRSSNPDRNYPWMLTNPQTQEREVVRDSKVTLISRLVPERKENA